MQYTSRMGTVGVKQERRNRHKSNSRRVVKNLEERKVGMKGKSPKQSLTCAKDLNIELSEGRESPYHRLD